MAEVEGPGEAWFRPASSVPVLARRLLRNVATLRLVVDRAAAPGVDVDREQQLLLAEGQIGVMTDVLRELAGGLSPEVVLALSRPADPAAG